MGEKKNKPHLKQAKSIMGDRAKSGDLSHKGGVPKYQSSKNR